MAGMRSLAGLAWRESRSARRRLLLYMSSIALGVAALVAIDSFTTNVTQAVQEQTRTLMGGDVQITAREPFSASVERVLDSLGRVGAPNVRATTFPAMAVVTRTGQTRMVQLRGVSVGYPWYGEITTEPAGRFAALQQEPYALVDRALLVATGGQVGDTLQLGQGRFVITGILNDVMGPAGIAAALGPRVYVGLRYLAGTQLLQFGATAEYMALLKLPEGVNQARIATPLRRRLRVLHVNVRTAAESAKSITNATETLGTFIGMVGLVALLLGGIGVASGVRTFVAQKIDTVAVLRCLGATSGQVLTIYVAQAALMGVIGAAIGAAIGVVVQFALPHVMGALLPVNVPVIPAPMTIVAGVFIGGWIALLFALRPLLAVRAVSPLQTLRRTSDAEVLGTPWSDAPRLVVDGLLVASVIVVALVRAHTLWQGVWISAATGAVILLLMASAAGLAFVARRVVRGWWPYVVRQGVANVYRPGNQTTAVILSLGFGAFLLTTLYLTQRSLLRDLSIDASSSGGNVVFFDVQEDQAAPLATTIRGHGYRVIQEAPVVSMRIAAINGRSTATLPEDRTDTTTGRPAGWALRREYRSTFRDSLMPGEQIVAGRWFGNGGGAGNGGRMGASSGATSGDTIGAVSLEQGVAQELHVKVNDTITWDVQGVQIPTRVTSLREVTWTRFEPNFFAVFDPRVLQQAPKQYIILASVRGAANIAALQRDVVRGFPNVSSVDLSLVTQTIGGIVSKVSQAIQYMAIFTVIMGIPVLISAVAATRRERVREGVLLRTLGATRGQVVQILSTEYAVLGLLGSLTGFVLAFGGGWALIHFVFKMAYFPTLGPTLVIAVVMMLLTVGIGLLAGRDVFRETPVAALRGET